MRYTDQYGEVFDEDDLYDRVAEAFTRDDFSNWVDDNYDGLLIDARVHILPSEALEVMGDFEDAYEDTIYRIVNDEGGLYPDLYDMGIRELDDGESESVRSVESFAYAKGRVAVGKMSPKARSTASRERNKVKTGKAADRAKARAKRAKASRRLQSVSGKGAGR